MVKPSISFSVTNNLYWPTVANLFINLQAPCLFSYYIAYPQPAISEALRRYLQ